MRERFKTRLVSPTLAWLVLAVALSLIVAGTWLQIAITGNWFLLGFGMGLTAFAVAGALILHRLPAHRMGWALMSLALFGGMSNLAQPYAQLELVASDWVAWVAHVIGDTAAPLAVMLVILLFPTGELHSSRWRWVLIGLIAFSALDMLVKALTPGQLPDFGPENPLGIEGFDFLSAIVEFTFIPMLLLSLPMLAVPIIRLRRAVGIERFQLKWFVYAATLMIVSLTWSALVVQEASTTAEQIQGAIFLLALILVPVTIAVAILRYRLYDIDVVINKTLVFVSLAVLITVVYVGIVVGGGSAGGCG